MRTQEELHARSLLLGIDWTDDTVVSPSVDPSSMPL